ncbi:MAG: hypothetical protein N4A46_10305 [Schleiferiaceae bacterium]|nr:hypothetical protein [Schleiferiaceae bacterium]
MKKTILALLAVATLGVACKKEETGGGGTTPPLTPSEKIVGDWKGANQVQDWNWYNTPGGVFDTTYQITADISWMNFTFNTDGTGSSDSLGFDPFTFNWMIHGQDLLVLDGTDTLMVTKLDETDLHMGRTLTDDVSIAPGVIEVDLSWQFTKN